MSNIDASTAALIGAVIAALISIIGLLVNNYIQRSNNMANILARRAEITLSKRLEAFQDLAACLANVSESAIGMKMKIRDGEKDRLDEQNTTLNKNFGKLAQSFGRNSIYVPSRIDESLSEKIEAILKYSRKTRKTIASIDEYQQLHNLCNNTLSLLSEEIRQYLSEK